MKEYRHISVKYIELHEFGVVVMKILDQTHRGKTFSGGLSIGQSHLFRAKNGVHLVSLYFPAYYSDKRSLFCLGSSVEHDNDSCVIPLKEWTEVYEAIVEYNETFNGKEDVQAMVEGHIR
jgi:hypothetical protein